MNSDEYADILRFLSAQEYPLYIAQSNNQSQCHLKRNFRLKAFQNRICEDKLFKVSIVNDKLHSSIYIYSVNVLFDNQNHGISGHSRSNTTFFELLLGIFNLLLNLLVANYATIQFSFLLPCFQRNC